MKIPFNKTKIICTIGPSSRGEGMLRKLLKEGMDIARFNLSHSTPQEHLQVIEKLRNIAQEYAAPTGIMVDLPGVKLRIGELKKEMVLKEGGLVKIRCSSVQQEHNLIPLPSRQLFRELKKKDIVYLDDGKIELVVLKKDSKECLCSIVNGGILGSRKSIHVKGKVPSIHSPTRTDLHFARFFASRQVDFVSLSYVKTAEEILVLKKIVKTLNPHCFIIAKIETPQALDNLESILRVSDGIMVARGDLGLQVEITRIGALQKEIIKNAKKYFLPTIVATQILESMTYGPFPQRAEVTDVTNAILDGADALLLSNETSVGRFPDKAVSVLRRISSFTEGYARPVFEKSFEIGEKGKGYLEAFSQALNILAKEVNAERIVVFTDNVEAVKMVSIVHLNQDVIVLSQRETIVNSLNIFYRVVPFSFSSEFSPEQVKKFLREKGWYKKGQKLPVLIALNQNYTIGIIS